jgi:ABC-type glycerol-3-phosphate transport system permease component
MAKKILIHFLALIVFLFCVGPLLLTLFGGIIPDAALLSYPPKWFSMKPSFAYYKYIFFGVVPSAYEERGAMRSMITEEARQIPHSMMNSAIIALSVMGINILFGGMAAFAFARIRFKGKSTTFMGIVMCRLLPAAAFVVPFYLIVQSLGLLDTKIAIILVHSILTLPFTVLILSVFFRKIPVDIEEAATVDGASRPQIFLKITLPLSAASMVATGLFAFMLSYSEFLYSLILSGTDKTRTLSVAMAALSITLIPSLILAILVWKFVVEGIILGAVKY